MFNAVCITGRLVAVPELREVKGGMKVTNFHLVWDERGQARKNHFFEFVSFGATAERIVAWAQKGRELSIQGRLITRKKRVKDANGNPVEYPGVMVQVDLVDFGRQVGVGEKKGGSNE